MTTTGPTRARVRRRILPTVVITAVTGLVTASFALADGMPSAEVGGAAAAYVPAEGHVNHTLETGGATDIRRIIEHTRSTGVTQVLVLPELQRASALEAVGDDARTTQFWRETSHVLDGEDTRQLTDLYAINDDGVSLVASYGGDVGWVYDPPMVQLPADVAPGVTWSGEGQAIPLGIATYRQRSSAHSPQSAQLIAVAEAADVDVDGCLQVDAQITLSGSDGEVLLEFAQSELWCAGLGRVASTVAFGDAAILHATVPPAPASKNVNTNPTRGPWSQPGSWAVREASIELDDPFFGVGPVALALSDTPRVTSDDLIVVATTDVHDVVALRLDGARLTQEWYAHPGGAIVTMATVGDITVVSTSQRRLVAYNADGHRLWQRATPELVVAVPTADAGDVITVGLDGTVTAANAVTGDVAWSTSVGADVDVSAVVAGGAVIVIDRAGAITALKRDTGEPLWKHEGESVAAMSAFGSLVVVVEDDGWLRSYDAATGEPSHAWRYRGIWRSLLAVDDVVVLATDEITIGVDPQSGAALWQREGVDGAVSDGRVVALIRDSETTMVDAAGGAVASWQVPASVFWATQHPIATSSGILLMHSGSTATLVGPR